MNLARVIGTIWATQKDPGLVGLGMRIVQPLDFERNPIGAPEAAVDAVGAGPDELVITVGSREASLPFDVALLPVDLAIVGIVDRIDGDFAPPWRK
ncbi:MAG: ethanolamine utilization protein EutN [Gemmatimonadetes bacterium]|nr:ethanolamine utilization protein EutN [Gemmatimonadota bacterium]